jgi:hypothetical protein
VELERRKRHDDPLGERCTEAGFRSQIVRNEDMRQAPAWSPSADPVEATTEGFYRSQEG